MLASRPHCRQLTANGAAILEQNVAHVSCSLTWHLIQDKHQCQKADL